MHEDIDAFFAVLTLFLMNDNEIKLQQSVWGKQGSEPFHLITFAQRRHDLTPDEKNH